MILIGLAEKGNLDIDHVSEEYEINEGGGVRGLRRLPPLLSLFPFCSVSSFSVCAVDMLGLLGRAPPRIPLQLLRGGCRSEAVGLRSRDLVRSGGVFVRWRRVFSRALVSSCDLLCSRETTGTVVCRFVHRVWMVVWLSFLLWACVCIFCGMVRVCHLWLAFLRHRGCSPFASSLMNLVECALLFSSSSCSSGWVSCGVDGGVSWLGNGHPSAWSASWLAQQIIPFLFAGSEDLVSDLSPSQHEVISELFLGGSYLKDMFIEYANFYRAQDLVFTVVHLFVASDLFRL
ncbi:hypothetical protein F2Q70_00037997 [Brassica cretica]|uniref:Uncharacterized protein n=1 Tax=Brassica cretica TaxID=69181 RepID=A0A8S9KDD1_BRACR|nr:hypothetical protein F2Q70_00037997 [Brassica cretica]